MKPIKPNTAPATEAKMAAVDQRYAERLRMRGWHCYAPTEVLTVMVEPGLSLPGQHPAPDRVTLQLRPAVPCG